MPILDPSHFRKVVQEIGKKLENEPISLERGSYVAGTISTGSLTINLMTGGGVPPGKWMTVWGPEQSGKTTLTMSTIAQALKNEVFVIQFDHEAAMDPIYAANLGVRTNDPKDKSKQNPYFQYTQPTTGEQTYRMMMRVLSELPDFVNEKGGRPKPSVLFVIDSLAAMSPEALIENDEASAMAQAGRMHSDMMRRVKGLLGRKNASVLATNQMRMKPGVCFDYNTRVVLADGTTERIGVIVKNKLQVEVMSFDPKTNKVVPRKVVGWFRNGYADGHEDCFLTFQTENAMGLNGYTSFACTPNHVIFTPEGERHAGDIRIGDKVLGRAQFMLNKLQRSVAYGSVLGDGSLRKQSTHKTELRIGHGPEQEAYLRWKASIFGELAGPITSIASDKGLGFTVKPSADLLDIYDEAYPSPGKRGLPKKLLKKLDLRAVAIWYMDDGYFVEPKAGWSKNGRSNISCCWLSDEDAPRLVKRLKQLGLPTPVLRTYFHKKSGKTSRALWWNGAKSRAFQQALAPYIHPSMEYKIHPELRGAFVEVPEQFPNYRQKMVPVTVLDIRKKAPGKFPYQMEKFDITVEGTHAYMVGSGGVGVHNSFGDPRYEPGGESVKFYADVKLRMVAVQKPFNERGREMRLINLDTTKNKVFPPFRVEKERLAVAFGRGWERYYDGLGFLDMMGKIEKGKGKSAIRVGDKTIDGDYSKDKLIEFLHTNTFRRWAQRYMESGEAFKAYLSAQSIAPDASINVEDAGLNYEKENSAKKDKKLKALEEKVAARAVKAAEEKAEADAKAAKKKAKASAAKKAK